MAESLSQSKSTKIAFGLIGVAVIIVVGILLYQKFQQDFEAQQLQSLIQQEEDRRARILLLYEDCLSDAYDLYTDNWNRSCKSLGKKKNCKLPSKTAKRWDDLHKEEEDKCYKKYYGS